MLDTGWVLNCHLISAGYRAFMMAVNCQYIQNVASMATIDDVSSYILLLLPYSTYEYYVKYICTYKFRSIMDAALYMILQFWGKLLKNKHFKHNELVVGCNININKTLRPQEYEILGLDTCSHSGPVINSYCVR